MEFLMFYLIVFIISFFTLLNNHFISIKKERVRKDIELFLFWNNLKKVNKEKLGLILVLLNSIIISLTTAVSTTFNFGYIWQILIALAFMYAFMYSTYNLIGIYIERRENKNGKHNKNRKKMAK